MKSACGLFCWIQFPAPSAHRGPWMATLTVSFAPKEINVWYTPFQATVDFCNTPTEELITEAAYLMNENKF